MYTVLLFTAADIGLVPSSRTHEYKEKKSLSAVHRKLMDVAVTCPLFRR